MTDKLSVWNGALTAIGERELANDQENREPRYVLERLWNRDFIETILQMGQWNFAIRSLKLEPDPNITTKFGYEHAYPQPEDYVRLVGFCEDEAFEYENKAYQVENGVFYTGRAEVYFRYVSNDPKYGTDFSKWPYNFTRFAEEYLGYCVTRRLTHSNPDTEQAEKRYKAALKAAKNTDAMEQPPKTVPISGWTHSRFGRRGDGGSRDRLLG